MTRNQVLKHAKSTYDTDPEYLFASDPDIAVLRNPSGKWYGIIMNISPKQIGLPDGKRIDVMNVKLEPMMVGSFLKKNGFYPAYHMNKTHWISIMLDKSKTVSDEDIKDLLDISYRLSEK